jgi:hypothetical protein
MAKQGTWYCRPWPSTHYSWRPENTPDGRKDRKRVEVHGPSFQKALKAGVKIAFGTDVGGFPWTDPMAQEFGRMVELGMSPMAAIQLGHRGAAEMLGKAGELGRDAARGLRRHHRGARRPLQDVESWAAWPS